LLAILQDHAGKQQSQLRRAFLVGLDFEIGNAAHQLAALGNFGSVAQLGGSRKMRRHRVAGVHAFYVNQLVELGEDAVVELRGGWGWRVRRLRWRRDLAADRRAN